MKKRGEAMGNGWFAGERRDIQARAFDFAVQIVRLHQRIAKQGSEGE